MNQPLDRMILTLSAIPEYEPLFSVAFPQQTITPTTVADAIATSNVLIVSAAAPFDAWIDGDEAAIPDAARRGFVLFNTKARCASCHYGWRFTDAAFTTSACPTAISAVGCCSRRPFLCSMPSRRRVARHDAARPVHARRLPADARGRCRALQSRWRTPPSQSELIGPLGLSVDEQRDLVALLQTLTTPARSDFTPALPR